MQKVSRASSAHEIGCMIEVLPAGRLADDSGRSEFDTLLRRSEVLRKLGRCRFAGWRDRQTLRIHEQVDNLLLTAVDAISRYILSAVSSIRPHAVFEQSEISSENVVLQQDFKFGELMRRSQT